MSPSETMSNDNSDGKFKTRQKSMSIPLETEKIEKFPSFNPSHNPSTKNKSKSVTEAEANSNILPEEDFTTAIERLKNEKPPESLVEVRDRRARAKKTRRDTINLIRSRTASRISASGSPSMEAREKVGLSG